MCVLCASRIGQQRRYGGHSDPGRACRALVLSAAVPARLPSVRPNQGPGVPQEPSRQRRVSPGRGLGGVCQSYAGLLACSESANRFAGCRARSRRPSGRPARSYSHAALTHLTFATSSVARGQLGSSETKGQQDITEGRATLAAHAAASGA